jgi:hypothetical protein
VRELGRGRQHSQHVLLQGGGGGRGGKQKGHTPAVKGQVETSGLSRLLDTAPTAPSLLRSLQRKTTRRR